MSHHYALEQYITATNTHQFEHVKQLLHPSAVYWFSDKTCTSLSDIQQYFENAWDTIKDEVYSISDVNWIAVDKNTATCIYTYHYTGYYNGDYISGSGRATNVFIKDNENDWKLIHEHLSSF
ncbi:nuclear transport factor 2 family protein [Paenibacillus sp. GSMTC-2017]|uniref:YybH family protein n=1 Tax=Paenibacillus sp. GSMTC-2017 TaxID=2794350 RepID=UPI0018D615FF|nr:nuclear transport factor 2 family protein [Paenibacillus sp. GSMTC-2017]MBH5319592.1 nuclear transport factor 2 family protein [Paenibacillus sp. GSMTC-2017]